MKNQKIMFAVKSVILISMVVFAVFSTLEKGISFHTFLPLFFIPMGVYMFIELKKIEKELAQKKE
ncbi:hypothetical protein [Polaribacter irgensii]|uniref:hypothetical protein n=1 Tax=Polaribacter irgensii TaxID=531 RepID=UPI001EE214E7|nr:hypothetical protein [Polaribacter irgensii]